MLPAGCIIFGKIISAWNYDRAVTNLRLLRHYLPKLLRLLIGFSLIAIAVVISKQAVSLSPWNVLSDGIAHISGLKIGQATVLISITILLVDVLARESLGIGLILNAVTIGFLTDFFFSLNGVIGLIPRAASIPMQILLCLLSCLVNALGIFIYLSARLGAGPRDGFIIFLSRKLRLPVGFCKLLLEAVVCLSGFLMGGEVGLGTLISVLCGGPFLQTVFRLFRFDARGTKHETLADTVRMVFHREESRRKTPD